MKIEKNHELAQPSSTELVDTDPCSKKRRLGREEGDGASPYRPRASGTVERQCHLIGQRLARENGAPIKCLSLDELDAALEGWLTAKGQEQDRSQTRRSPTKGGKSS